MPSVCVHCVKDNFKALRVSIGVRVSVRNRVMDNVMVCVRVGLGLVGS